MSKIFARSPYVLEIDESSVVGSKVELYFYYTGSAPANPQYTLTKKVPSSTNLKMYYDVSTYCRDYLEFTTRQSVIGTLPSTSGIAASANNQYVNVSIKRYKETTAGNFTLLDTTSYMCFDGYGYYSEGSNPTNADYIVGSTRYTSLEEGTYYYKYSTSSTPASIASDRSGIMGINASTVDGVKYTDLSSGATTQFTTPFASATVLYDVPTVWVGYYGNGNKLELWQGLGGGSPTLLGTWNFKPVCEPKYTPIMIDFINKFGYWQREWFFKVSNNNINTKQSTANLMQSSSHSYNTIQGQRKGFNNNGQESITVNSGNVEESYFETVKQIMLSEKIIVDDLPVLCNTKSLKKQKGINQQKPANYQLTFEYAFDAINSVI